MSTQQPQERRYCENCRFCIVPESGLRYARCERAGIRDDGAHYISPKFAGPKPDEFCSTVRSSTAPDRCGPSALWFEAKPAVQEAAE
jgi:hypothetical protein